MVSAPSGIVLAYTLHSRYEEGTNVVQGLGAVVLIALAIGIPVLHIWSFVDVSRMPEASWVDAGFDRGTWSLMVLFVFVVGPILYLSRVRPRLSRASAD